MHRDLKPENILIDENGYLHLTDFGIARFWKPENGNENSGTPCYMAPEILSRENHGIVVDYYALGIIAHELLLSKRPFHGKTRKEVKEATYACQYKIEHSTHSSFSEEAASFVNSCLKLDPEKRLGFDGPSQLKNHPWLKEVSFFELEIKKVESPLKPQVFESRLTLVLKQSYALFIGCFKPSR